jgi:hypothetical protein
MNEQGKGERVYIRGDVDIADFTAMGFIGFDMDATVRIPEAYGTVFTATEDIITVGVEPRSEYATFVTFQNVHFLLRKIFHAHRFFHYRNGTQRGLSKIVLRPQTTGPMQ